MHMSDKEKLMWQCHIELQLEQLREHENKVREIITRLRAYSAMLDCRIDFGQYTVSWE